jgi:hypothetical protein
MLNYSAIPVGTATLDGSEEVIIFKNGKPFRYPLWVALDLTISIQTSIPVGFTATTLGSSSISLTWTNGATNYILERQLEGNAWKEIYSGSLGTFTDTLLTSSNQYFYRLKAQQTGLYDSDYATDDATTDPGA